MGLQEKLERFKKQQEKCQSTLSTIAASKASSLKSPPPPPPPSSSSTTTTTIAAASSAPGNGIGRNQAAAAAPAVKFSNDTERLQHINSIRKAPIGAQMKRVIDLLFEIATVENPADMMTKLLPIDKFKHCLDLVNICRG